MIQGQLTAADYVAAQYLHLRPRYLWIALVAVAAGGVSMAITSALAGVITFAIVSGFYLANLFVVLPWKSKRTFREYKALSQPLVVDVQENGLLMKRESGTGLVTWPEIIRWRVNPHMVLVYPARNLFFILPAQFFGSEEAFRQFCVLLEARAGKAVY